MSSPGKFPIHTLDNECHDCYKCVRQCPVKAIRIRKGHASIVPALCIACGHCVEVCPARVKRVRNDIDSVREMIRNGDRVYASLAPAYLSEFHGMDPGRLIAALRRLGFAGVSEGALGAEAVSHATALHLAGRKDGLHLSTACPAAVEYVGKYLPDMAKKFVPIASPAMAHAAILKQRFGQEVRVVSIGPCTARKIESDRYPSMLDATLSFNELRAWFLEEHIRLSRLDPGEEDVFVPDRATTGSLCALEGGMIRSLETIPSLRSATLIGISSIECIDHGLRGLDLGAIKGPVFVELMACKGGCIHGPCMSFRNPGVIDQMAVMNAVDRSKSPEERIPPSALAFSHKIKPIKEKSVDEEAIQRALASVGKNKIHEELNCSGCGYESCRTFAMALLDGRAETSMCLSFLHKKALNKANTLMQKMPAGIVLVNAGMKIIECNPLFATMLGEEASLIYEACPGLGGAVLNKMISFSHLFEKVIHTGKEIRRNVRNGSGGFWNVIIFSIEPGEVACGVLMDVSQTERRREEIAQKAREVIRKNLITVQEVACMLGENMADTEILLRSLAEDFSIPEVSDGNGQEEL
ncbi:MAG: 4Fe-4S dicluster domain-containing protein [Desulfobacter sp.]|nr:MAG: 4Fe-4S dicluster domain-containing protein [Desulfobacter sp.]